jgi:hypothetical protein
MKEGKPWMYIIYEWTKVSCHSFSKYSCLLLFHPVAPTLAEMRLNLLDAKTSTSKMLGSVNWLIEGISIEDAQ